MNDFLTRLADLTHGEAAMVNPRLPGPYAPTPDAGFIESADILVTHRSEGDSRDEAASPVSAPGPDRKEESRNIASESRVKGVAEGEPGRQASSTPPARPQREEDRGIDDDSLLFTALSPPAGKKSGAAERGELAGKAGELGEMALEQPNAARLEGETPGRIAPDVLLEAGATTGQDRPEGISTADQSPLLVQVQQPGTDPRQVFKQQSTARQETRQKPSVHINIGRVEVRANTTAPKPEPGLVRSRRPDSLSLQDYLKGSNGRGERS